MERLDILWLVAFVKHTRPHTQCFVRLLLSRWWWQICCVLMAITQAHSQPNCSLIITDFNLIGKMFNHNNFHSSRNKKYGFIDSKFQYDTCTAPWHVCRVLSLQPGCFQKNCPLLDKALRYQMVMYSLCICVCELCIYVCFPDVCNLWVSQWSASVNPNPYLPPGRKGGGQIQWYLILFVLYFI